MVKFLNEPKRLGSESETKLDTLWGRPLEMSHFRHFQSVDQ